MMSATGLNLKLKDRAIVAIIYSYLNYLFDYGSHEVAKTYLQRHWQHELKDDILRFLPIHMY